MKITGYKRKGRHLHKNTKNGPEENFSFAEVGTTGKKAKKPGRRKRTVLTILAVIFAVLIAGGVYSYFFVKEAIENAPPIRVDPTGTEFQTPVVANSGKMILPGPPSGNAVQNSVNRPQSQVLKYTFLVLALDDDNGNTDVLMAATLDTTNHTLEVVNIPRDTLANVGWNNVKRVNTIYANMRYQHGWDDKSLDASMEGAVECFADILGFKVDYWFLVDMKAFVALIDAIDGVDFDIPVNMNYDDVQAGLSIHYTKGIQHLYGKEALQVMRFRKGYSDQDIGRIGTQQDFLMSAAKQILAKKSSISVYDLARIFLNNVKTDIGLDYLIWFGHELLKLDADDINFSIMPGLYWDSVGGDSYVTIYVNQWLELVNEKLNPFTEDITTDDVSILTRGSDGRLYVTDGNRKGNASWGSNSVGQGYSGDSSGVSNVGSASPDSNATQAMTPTDSGNNPPETTGDNQPGNPGENPTSEITDVPPDGSDDDPGSNQTDDPDATPDVPGDMVEPPEVSTDVSPDGSDAETTPEAPDESPLPPSNDNPADDNPPVENPSDDGASE